MLRSHSKRERLLVKEALGPKFPCKKGKRSISMVFDHLAGHQGSVPAGQ